MRCALLLLLLSGCAPARGFLRGGHAGFAPQLAVLAVEALDPQLAPVGPFCDPIFSTCPDRRPQP